jgi:general secretion pathway protein C
MGNGVFGVNRQALSQAITPRTMQQASVVPTPDGLVMQQIDPGSIFERLGLSPGDTVRHINGRPVTNLQEAMSVYAEITNSAESEDISVEISRGGRTEVLTYQVPSQSQP